MMAKQESVEFLSLNKTEDQLVLVAFVCILFSFIFGLQEGLLFEILWAAVGCGALICIYFAFPNMWTYGLLLYAAYVISAFGIILIIFWMGALSLIGISVPTLLGIFFIISAFYMAFHTIKYVKRARDAQVKEGNYLSLGFWSIGVMLFVAFSILSILSWALWVNTGQLQFYFIFEPLLAFLLVYILWLPDRNIDWSIEQIPESPATKFIADRSKILKEKMTKVKRVCPECGSKLKIEKKKCPSCEYSQTFGWCVTSEAYVLPCSKCGEMALYGKKKCNKCGKALSDSVQCNSCKKSYPIKEWIAQS